MKMELVKTCTIWSQSYIFGLVLNLTSFCVGVSSLLTFSPIRFTCAFYVAFMSMLQTWKLVQATAERHTRLLRPPFKLYVDWLDWIVSGMHILDDGVGSACWNILLATIVCHFGLAGLVCSLGLFCRGLSWLIYNSYAGTLNVVYDETKK